MKILFVTNIYAPDFCGGAALTTDLAEGLIENGHTVDVFGAYPYYPEWTDKSGQNGLRIREEKDGRLRVLRHGLVIPKKPKRLTSRLAYELSFMLSLMRSLFRGGRYDVIVAFCPMFGCVAFTALRTLFGSEKTLLVVQDLPAEAASAAGISRSKFFNGFATWLQSAMFSRFSAWATINDQMKQKLDEIKPPDTHQYLIPNWLTGSQTDSIRKFGVRMPTSHGVQPRLLYCGNIGEKQGVLDFCKFLSATSLDFSFDIRGDGAGAAALREWHQVTQDPRFDVAGFLSEEDFVKGIAQADLFVVTEKAGAGNSFMPSKLIPCLSIGTPVLAVCDPTGPLGREVTEYDCGLIFSWDRLNQFESEFSRNHADPDRMQTFSDNCLHRAEHYSRATAISRYNHVLSSLAGIPLPEESKELTFTRSM